MQSSRPSALVLLWLAAVTNNRDSVEKIGIGAELVDQPGATTDEIIESVIQVIDVAGEMTAASQKQTAGIEQID